jgi:hypothetical protein
VSRPDYDEVEYEVLSTLTKDEQLRLVGAILADMVDGGATADEARATLIEALDGAVHDSSAFDGYSGPSNIIH